MGPYDLQVYADVLERPTKEGARMAREGIRRCADAWEIDRARIEALEKSIDNVAGDVVLYDWVSLLESVTGDGLPLYAEVVHDLRKMFALARCKEI